MASSAGHLDAATQQLAASLARATGAPIDLKSASWADIEKGVIKLLMGPFRPEQPEHQLVALGLVSSDSFAGLRALRDKVRDDDFVLVHDAARPCVLAADIDRLIDLGMPAGGALLAAPLRDTLKRADATGRVVGMFSRATGNGLRNAVEYGHLTRVGVRSRLAIEGLGLETLLARGAA